MQVRAVLFDLDGTLVDSFPGIEFSVDCSLAECHAPQRHRDLRPLIGPPIRSILQELAPDADKQQLSALEQAFRTSYDSEGWRKTVLHDGALETLTRLRMAGLGLFLATNKPLAPTQKILDGLGIAGLFTDVLCRDCKTPPFQSKQEMLQDIVATHRLSPAACIYVGDSFEDFRAASEAGVPVALVAHGYGALQFGRTGYTPLTNLRDVLNMIGILEVA
jgi:phosphoglycolate phosphatase